MRLPWVITINYNTMPFEQMTHFDAEDEKIRNENGVRYSYQKLKCFDSSCASSKIKISLLELLFGAFQRYYAVQSCIFFHFGHYSQGLVKPLFLHTGCKQALNLCKWYQTVLIVGDTSLYLSLHSSIQVYLMLYYIQFKYWSESFALCRLNSVEGQSK